MQTLRHNKTRTLLEGAEKGSTSFLRYKSTEPNYTLCRRSLAQSTLAGSVSNGSAIPHHWSR